MEALSYTSVRLAVSSPSLTALHPMGLLILSPESCSILCFIHQQAFTQPGCPHSHAPPVQ